MIINDHALEESLQASARLIKEILFEAAYFGGERGVDGSEPLRIDKDIKEELFDEPVKKSIDSIKAVAIDGGSAKIVDGGSFYVGVYRFGRLTFFGGEQQGEQISAPTVEALSPQTSTERFKEIHLEVTGSDPVALPTFGEILGAIRTLLEWQMAEESLGELQEGDLILMDGSLKATDFLPPAFLERILKKAAQKGVFLAGVSKKSSLSFGKYAPLIQRAGAIGNGAKKDKAWFYPLSRLDEGAESIINFGAVYAARLSPLSDFAFRIDINRFDTRPPAKVMGILQSISNDPVYLGYPYPLAAVHNRVRIEPADKEDLRYRLEGLTLQEGVPLSDWEALFGNFHDILDTN
ncbi:MAG: DNA double-strand break repair nuclease NurA [Actinomycetota bacterium]|nr:DNA double-strand break repair nuclease NurA [Actinomycetota bacterium]